MHNAVRTPLIDRLFRAPFIPEERLRQVGGLLRELQSFGLIGGINAVADILLFTLLHLGAGIGPLSAKVISGLITIIASYYANRRWTWPHRPGREQQRLQLIHFATIAGVGLLLAEACLGFSHYVLGLHSALADNLAANVVGLALGTAWRFWASRRWVFTNTQSTGTPGPTPSHPAGEHEQERPHPRPPRWATLDELLAATDMTKNSFQKEGRWR